MERNSQLIIVGVMLLVILAGFGLFIAFTPKTASQAPKTYAAADLITPTSTMTGSATAAVTLVEWGDFECPFCATEAPILEQLAQKYAANPQFNLVFRHFPLPQHANSRAAAEAVEAAGAQGKFWEMYQALYAHQKEWVGTANPRAAFDSYATTLGLDLAKFDADLDAHTFAAKIEADYQTAGRLKLDHTPTIILNGVDQTDLSAAGLSAQIDAALASSTQPS